MVFIFRYQFRYLISFGNYSENIVIDIQIRKILIQPFLFIDVTITLYQSLVREIIIWLTIYFLFCYCKVASNHRIIGLIPITILTRLCLLRFVNLKSGAIVRTEELLHYFMGTCILQLASDIPVDREQSSTCWRRDPMQRNSTPPVQ